MSTLFTIRTLGLTRTMAGRAFFDEHNELAMLQKPKQAEGFHAIVDFLKSSHIAHALTINPTIYVEHQRQFWANAIIHSEEGTQVIQTRVCDKPLTISEECIRIHLRLDDALGITSLPKEKLFQTLRGCLVGGVSPNPKKVLNKEKEEHIGCKAHTTDFAQSAGQDSVNISKTFPMATLGEQSSKGPRCQETKGVEGAFARQKTSTKRSKDPSWVVNTPKGGEDIYNYDELMETMGNINLDVIKQGADIEEMKLVILSQQVQITKLKKMVLRLVKKKRRKQYVLKKRGDDFNKGERQAEGEKQSPVGMESKAKLDTPKATPKAKGVVIKEVGSDHKKKKISVDDEKKKGKEKMVESEQPLKKQKQIELDEELARKMQAELKKEEETQSAKDREIALEMVAKFNEEYQKSLKSAAAAKKVTKKASRQRLPLKTRQRQPSKTYLANQERSTMINFLKGAIGVPEGMFTSMSFGKLEELYQKEMAKLKGESIQREEAERKMKERHDLNIQQPFPESEEGTPIKEKKEEKKEETLAHQIGVIKRKKSIATKPKAKRARIEEERAEAEVEPTDEPLAEPEQNPEQFNPQSNEQFDLYMTVTNEDPVQADPISVQAPEIIHWDILEDQRKKYFRIKRMGDKVQHVVRDLQLENKFQRIENWMLFEMCGVYVITVDRAYHEYYLVDKIYDHSKAKLQGMLNAKLICAKDSEMARIKVSAASKDKEDLKIKISWR
ncbi:hypothetical protein L6452_27053 [Arctium lappa]|uniref:Uncharacterized protein n=1 Tax=Arctium lappa TaxID=4217 RepID=A0ACB8ZVS0_ARCLA|nr:hypothetical protein L6452_27053 [Arctium lappa]